MAFYERCWIEMWGTGTTRMIEFCRKNGTPESEFREYAGGFAVVFPFKEVMNTEAVLPSEVHLHSQPIIYDDNLNPSVNNYFN